MIRNLSDFRSGFSASLHRPVIITCIHGKKAFNSFYYSSLRSPRWQGGDGRRRPGHARRRRHQALPPARFGGSTRTRFWQDLPDRPPTPSRCSPASSRSWSSITATWAARAVELAKDWRTDKMLRSLEALLLVADQGQTFLISGQGDVIEPDTGIAAIGSGGPYATAAATALYRAHAAVGARDRRRSHEDCRQDLHLYQRQGHD